MNNNLITSNASDGIYNYVNTWKQSFDDPANGSFNDCGWWCLNPFMNGGGLTSYHVAKGLYRVVELAFRTLALGLATLATIVTLGCISELNQFIFKESQMWMNSLHRNVYFIPQFIIHVLGVGVGLFHPTAGITLQMLAMEMDRNSDRRDYDLELALNQPRVNPQVAPVQAANHAPGGIAAQPAVPLAQAGLNPPGGMPVPNAPPAEA